MSINNMNKPQMSYQDLGIRREKPHTNNEEIKQARQNFHQ